METTVLLFFTEFELTSMKWRARWQREAEDPEARASKPR